ncbi:hypothetical protein [Marisediminicola sp. LYQ134]|uniref:hypothetical protein n=1 Tax=Marisediminicola sp. LYQ134 TaxID=3391061 RepID=UPI0039835B31
MTLHIVTAAVVKVSVGAPPANRVANIVRRGGIVPEGVDEKVLKNLLSRGLIEVLPEPEPVDEDALAAARQAEFDATVQAAAEKLVTEQLAPHFDQRVLEEAQKLEAARTSGGTTPAPATPAKPAAAKPTTK